jgi:hypothetical protein
VAVTSPHQKWGVQLKKQPISGLTTKKAKFMNRYFFIGTF